MTEGVQVGMTEGPDAPSVIPDVFNRESMGFSPCRRHTKERTEEKGLDSR